VGHDVSADDVGDFDGVVVLCTGSRDGRKTYESANGVGTAVDVLRDGLASGDGEVAVWDPIGGPIGVSVAETLAASGRAVRLVTSDMIAGNELSRTGDLAPANVRLQAAGVGIERRSIVRSVSARGVTVEDRFTGATRVIDASLIDAGHRLPDDALWTSTGSVHLRAGDCVAPRTIHEAILEGRRAALAIETLP
jgi:2,4-dienoyl-CoA reductase (NADPH2)